MSKKGKSFEDRVYDTVLGQEPQKNDPKMWEEDEANREVKE